MSWSIAPLLFGLAGAAAGALDALLSGVVISKYGNDIVKCVYVGGGIGLGIGSAMCLSRKARVCILSSPLLGAAGYFLTISVESIIGRAQLPQWEGNYPIAFQYIPGFFAPTLRSSLHVLHCLI